LTVAVTAGLQEAEYHLTVVARDGGTPQRSATMATVVTVIDDNDHAPRFEERQYVMDVREDVDVGTFIGRVSASDGDHGDNALITYSFSRQTQVCASQHCTQADSFKKNPAFYYRPFALSRTDELMFYSCPFSRLDL